MAVSSVRTESSSHTMAGSPSTTTVSKGLWQPTAKSPLSTGLTKAPAGLWSAKDSSSTASLSKFDMGNSAAPKPLTTSSTDVSGQKGGIQSESVQNKADDLKAQNDADAKKAADQAAASKKATVEDEPEVKQEIPGGTLSHDSEHPMELNTDHPAAKQYEANQKDVDHKAAMDEKDAAHANALNDKDNALGAEKQKSAELQATIDRLKQNPDRPASDEQISALAAGGHYKTDENGKLVTDEKGRLVPNETADPAKMEGSDKMSKSTKLLIAGGVGFAGLTYLGASVIPGALQDGTQLLGQEQKNDAAMEMEDKKTDAQQEELKIRQDGAEQSGNTNNMYSGVSF